MNSFNDDLESLLSAVLAGDDIPEDDKVEAKEEAPVLPPETLTPVRDRVEDIPADELTLDDILNPPEIEATKEDEPCAAESNESPDDTGTEPEASATPPASDEQPEQDGGATTSSVTDVTQRVSDDADVAQASLPAVDETAWATAVESETIPLPEFTTDELMESLDIRNFGTLVSLTTQRWHAKARDRKAAQDAATASGADKEAFEARKRLLVGADEKLRAVHTAIDAARTDHYKMTLPWSQVGVNDVGKRAGPRLLPNTLFFDYTTTMAKHKAEMDDALDEFVKAYPTLIAIAQQRLGSSFDFAQYPQPSVIDKMFDLSWDFLPIPIGEDFDGVALQQAEKLAMAVNAKTKTMLENAMHDAWKRLDEDVRHAYSSLSNPNARFHYTLVDKLREHASMLTHLNVTKDQRIEAIRAEIEKKLCRWDVKEIRKDDALRATMAESAKAILGQMEAITNVS